MDYHASINLVIAAAYFFIPLSALRIWDKLTPTAREPIILFAAFILSCGIGHFSEGLNLHKFVDHWYTTTAIISWVSAIYFARNLSRLLEVFETGTLLLRHSPSGIGIFRSSYAPDGVPDLLWVARSDSALYDLGFDPTKVKTWLGLGQPGHREKLLDEYREVLLTGVPILGRELYYKDPVAATDGWFYQDVVKISDELLLVTWSNITTLKNTQAQLEYRAKSDTLTGIGNRYALSKVDIEHSNIKGAFYINLDRFKVINDTLGHDIGDDLLKAIVGRLKLCSDNDDQLFRLGGDEFLVLVQHPKQLSGLLQKAKTFLKEIQRPYWIADRELRIDASIGVADRDAGDLNSILRAADIAMYKAKESGGSVLAWDKDLLAKQVRKEQIQIELHNTRDKYSNEFKLYYQPIYDLDNLEIIGAEALLRWQSSELGWVSPGEFIPIAEDTSEISRISTWVIDEAVSQIAKWNQRIPVSINVSPWDLEQTEFINKLRRVCDKYNVEIKNVSLEITERAVASKLQYYEEVLTELSALHVALKIDDFGTGDSSLRRLLNSPWNTVKIDRSLIPLDDTDLVRINVCRAVAGLCRDLGIQTIAEGIETEEQLELIRGISIDAGQGYFLARPMPSQDMFK